MLLASWNCWMSISLRLAFAEPVAPSRRPEVELMMVPRPLPSSAMMGFRSMELRVSFCCWLACGFRGEARQTTYDHLDEVGKTRLEDHFCGDVLDQEVHPVDGEVDTGIEGEELQDLGVEVDLCGEVLHLDVDLTDMH
jgi:hypothetical protein